MKKEKGGERFENRVSNTFYVLLLCGVCTPVLLYQYYMTYIIYMSVFLQSTCSITIGSCTLKEKVTTSLSFIYSTIFIYFDFDNSSAKIYIFGFSVFRRIVPVL